jgi:hypothetical protein
VNSFNNYFNWFEPKPGILLYFLKVIYSNLVVFFKKIPNYIVARVLPFLEGYDFFSAYNSLSTFLDEWLAPFMLIIGFMGYIYIFSRTGVEPNNVSIDEIWNISQPKSFPDATFKGSNSFDVQVSGEKCPDVTYRDGEGPVSPEQAVQFKRDFFVCMDRCVERLGPIASPVGKGVRHCINYCTDIGDDGVN